MLNLTHLRFDPAGFSWTLESDRTDVMQASYCVQVSADADCVKVLWDSSVVTSDASVCVPYGGDALASGSTYHWRVRVVDNHGEESGWSAPERILTGLLPQDWRGSFVTPDEESDAATSKGKLLRKEFSLEADIASATVHVTALGLYELFLNGHRVGDALLCPGWTEYDKRLLHQTYDVTSLLSPGANAVGAMLGAGWYKGDLASWTNQRAIYGKRTALLMQLTVRYQDGREQVVVSDATWRASEGPVLFSELYHGETYDARLEQPGWNQPNFDDASWYSVQAIERDLSTVVPQDGPPVRRQEVFPVREVIVTPKGEKVLDFGQNMGGWVRFKVRGQAGERVRLLHAEVLDREGNFYTGNMRGARNEIVFTLGGNGQELYEPHFTFQGFRYVQVAEHPGELVPEDFEAIAIHSDMERTGWFACSNPLLNQLHQNILWGLKGNFIDIPTDCPQRDERLGWTGDAQVFVRAATYLVDAQAFFRKWLRDLRAAQFANGAVPFVVPDVLTGQFLEGDIIANAESVSGWGDAAVIIPWTIYQAYGDSSVLAECYDSMKGWVEYIHQRAQDGLLWNNDYQLGDWVALDAKEGSYFGATATDLIATAYYAHVTDLLAKSARILGYGEDAKRYETLRSDIGAAYADEFFSRTGRLVSPTQTAHILSLSFGLTPERYRDRTIQGLLKLISDNDGHLTTGFLGTPHFCQVLADNGCIAQAYDLLLRTDYPSWLYQITKGATTVWEHWDGIKPDGSMWSENMNSFNHYAYGSVAEFLYRSIAGIDTDAHAAGYKQLRMKPQPGGGLSHASATVITRYGLAKAAWAIDGQAFAFTVTVPHNATACVCMPDGSETVVGSGVHQLTCKIDVD